MPLPQGAHNLTIPITEAQYEYLRSRSQRPEMGDLHISIARYASPLVLKWLQDGAPNLHPWEAHLPIPPVPKAALKPYVRVSER